MVITLANQKGGVAKTTSTYNIGAELANRGYRVLMIDFDPQASLTIFAGLEPYEQETSIVDIMKKTTAEPKKVVVNIKENLDIITSRIELAGVELDILNRSTKDERELILSRAIDPLQDIYDYIVIDCPPQLSTLTINALACADKVVIPCQTDYLAYRGLKQLMETIATIKEYFRPQLEVVGLLATLFDSRVNDDKEILELLHEEYHVIGVIKKAAQAKKGMYDGLASVDFAPKSELAQSYKNVVDTLI